MRGGLVWFAIGIVFISTAPLTRAQDEPADAKPPLPDRATLEKQFQETMSGAVLSGFFTIDGRRSDGAPLEQEKYTITKARKVDGDRWQFNTRIQYGGKDVTLPMRFPVKWAGDTPVITLTNVSIPGLGSAFTARVLIYQGQYAGTWKHGKVGGHMFGTITKLPPPKPKTDAAK